MKKIWILLGCLILTGCNIKYNINIDDELKVTEIAIVNGDEELYESQYRTSKNKILEDFLDIYGTSLEENNYQYKLNRGEDPYVEIRRQYNNIGDYLDGSKLFNDYFEKINFTNNGRIIKIETEGFNPVNPDDQSRFSVNDLDIYINLPFKVLNHNATDVNENTNTYHFVLKKGMEDFKILLEFDSSIKFNPNFSTIMKVLIAVLIIILTWVVVYYLNKHKNI